MKKIIVPVLATSLLSLLLFSCKKNTSENFNLSRAKVIIANAINPVMGVNNKDSVKGYSGTMIANTTYTVVGNIEIPAGDTIFVQSGVTVCMENNACIVVRGVLICIGTQAAPIWFTVCGKPKTDDVGQPQATDSAWGGGLQKNIWPGIQCDTSCTLLVLKWTHIEFAGAGASTSLPCANVSVGASTTNFTVQFQNTNGNFIMEDSWIYGTQDDAVRVATGHFDIMRNTFEKQGYIGGDCNNMKSGSVGDCAYNLYVGTATNGSKASQKGSAAVQCNMNIYNNTYINCGYRQISSGKGACINYEQGARGSAYNNLIINCKVGLRIVGSPIADTTNCFYGNNYIYGDSTTVTTQFYPVGYITKPNAYNVPNPSVTGYVYNPGNGAAQPTGAELTDDIALDGGNNPLFVNFPLPENATNFPGIHTFLDINNDNAEHNWDFHLQSGSPAIGMGNTDASYMLNACAAVSFTYIDQNGLRVVFTPNESVPCSDAGCYPTSYAGGNQHVNGEQ